MLPYTNSADKSHIKLSYVTHFYMDQKDASFVSDLLHCYSRYSRKILDYTHFVIVDDCSPTDYSIPKLLDLNITWLKILDNKPWNMSGARNLGVAYAKSDKILLSDIDHEFSESTLHGIVKMKNPGRTMYRMRRFNPENREIRQHSNTYFLSRARYLGLYGYDEEFSGNYGYEDILFWRWQRYNGTKFLQLNKKYSCRHRKIDYENTYHSLERDKVHNSALRDKKINLWKLYGPTVGHSRIFLNFKWEVIYSNDRALPVTRSKNTLWKKTWPWRWLVGGP